MIDFPASPIDGQVFSAANGVVYKWSATYSSWLAQGPPPVIGGVGEVTVTAAGYAMTNSVSDRIAFATLVVGNAGLWWSTSTNRYTPPAGKYFLIFTGNAQAPVGGNGTATIFLRKNGAQVGGGVSGSGSASFTIPLTLGQYVDANGTDYFEWWSFAAAANMQFQGGTFSAFPLTGIQGPTGGAPGSVVGDFMAAHSTFMSLGSTALVLPFNTVVNGNSGSYYNTANGRWTPPAGRYLLRASGYMYATASAGSSTLQFKKNGVFIDPASAVTSGGGWASAITAEALVNANGTDYFEAFGSSGNSAQFYVGTLLAYPTQGMVGPPGPAGPPGQIGWRQISNQTVTGAAVVDVTAIPVDINHLQVFFDLTPSVNDVDLALAFYNGSGVLENSSGNYLFGSYETNNTLAIGSTGGAASSTSSSNSSVIILDWPQTGNRVGSVAGSSIAGDFRIPNIRDATRQKKVQWQCSYINGNNNIFMCVYGSGLRQVATMLTGFRLYFGSGNLSGNVIVWGSP